MPSSVGDINIYKVSIGDLYTISKISVGEKVVYSAGNVVTYHVDSGISYQEEIDEGESCLLPKTFIPTKSGWEFVGWRTDATASGTVLSSKVMGDDPITLYAVFRQSVTVTYYNDSTTASSESKHRYYNNGNIANPSFTLTQASRSGWTARGWSTSNSGDGSITYANGATFTRDSSITLYGLYQQTITVTYYNNSTTASTTTGTRYWAPAGYINPSFTLTQAARSGWTARGWSTSNSGDGSITYANGATFTRDSSITLYGLYQQTITVTYYNNSTTASTTTGTRYWAPAGYINPSFTLTQAARSGWTARGWSTSTAGDGGISYNNGASFTRDSNIILYGMYQQTITVDYYNGSTSKSTTSGTRYYNSGSGSVVNPSFTLTQAALFGWTARGWSTSNKGDASITYVSGTTFTRDSNITLYGLYSQTITLTTVANGVTTKNNGTRYWAPAGYINPTFTVSNPTNGDATFQGWSASAGSTEISNLFITNWSLSSSQTRYAVFKYDDIAITSPNVIKTYNFTARDETKTIYTLDTTKYESHTVTAKVTRLTTSNSTTGVAINYAYVDDTRVRSRYTDEENETTDFEDAGYVGSYGASFTLTHAGNLTARFVLSGFINEGLGFYGALSVTALKLNGKTVVG